MAAQPRLALHRSDSIVAGAQWWLLRVVRRCAQVVLAVACGRRATFDILLAWLYRGVLRILLTMLSLF